MYETHLQNAVSKLEKLCDITILPLTISSEQHDYSVSDYLNWGWLQLYKVPVQAVIALRGAYPNGTNVITYPGEWISVRGESGQINVIPNQGGLGAVIVGQGGDFLPLIMGGTSHVPNLWQVDYVAGMDTENMPRMVVEAIAKMACIDLLAIFSDLVRPVGVSSESVSADGLSQSMSYQAPAFASRITQYNSDLYGPQGKQQDLSMTSGLLRQILDAYRPINMASV